MAVSLERFSIREYASKMRAVDVSKCWPFGGDSGDGALLPPIAVAKFRWWAEEAELMRSRPPMAVEKDDTVARVQENKEESEIPENKSTSVVTVPESDDTASSRAVSGPDDDKTVTPCPVGHAFSAVGCLKPHAPPPAELEEEPRMKTMTKAKGRQPKKRSIVEIFAVSPQIDTVHFDDEEIDDSGRDDGDDVEHSRLKTGSVARFVSNKKKKKENRSRLKADIATIGSQDRTEKLKNLVKKRKKSKIDQFSEKKTSVDFSRNMNGSVCNMGSAKDIVVTVSIQKRKPSVKYVSAERKHKIQTSKSFAKQRKPLFPVRGILKNQNGAISRQKSPASCKTQEQSVRHVRFSDDIASSSINEQQAGGIEESNTVYVSGSDEDMSASTESESEDQTMIEKKLASGDDVDTLQLPQPHISFQDEAHHCSDNSGPLNQTVPIGDDLHVFCQGDKITRHKPSYDTCNLTTSHDGIPGAFSVPREGDNPNVSTQVSGFVPRACSGSGKLINYFGDPSPKVVPMGSTANLKVLPRPSSCFSTNQIANQRLPFLPQIMAKTRNVHDLHPQPLHYPSAQELMGRLHSFPEEKKGAVMLRERCGDEDFFGLPLNSRGELIQLSSSGKSGFNQLKKPGTAAATSSSLPFFNHGLWNCSSTVDKHFSETVDPNAELKSLPMQNCAKGSSNLNGPSRLSKGEFQGIGGANVHWLDSMSGNSHFSSALDSELDLTNISHHQCEQYDLVKNITEGAITQPQGNLEHVTPPTMRLMGKDVTVGKSSKDTKVSEDGKIWTDKEIIAEDNPTTSTSVDSISMRRHDWVWHPRSEKSNEGIDFRSNQTLKSILQTKARDSGFSQACLHRRTNRFSPNGCTTVCGSLNSSAHPLAHPPVPSAMFKRAPDIQNPFTYSSESFKIDSGIPFSAYSPLSICQHMHPSSSEFMYKQDLPHTTKSGFKFPFPRPEYREHVQPFPFQGSSMGLPPWLLHATEHNETSITSHPYSHVSGTNFTTFLSPCHSSGVPYPYNSMTSHSHLKSSLGPASCVHPPLIPVPPGSKPVPISMTYKNKITVKDRMKSKPFFSKRASDCSKKPKKRPTGRSSTTQSTKSPDLERLEGSGALALLIARGKSANDIQHYSGAFEVDSSRVKATSTGQGPNETQKNGLRSSSVTDSYNLDGVVMSGPIKLSAGAKHILKPCQSMDQDGSKPTHSTIPFSSATESNRILESKSMDQDNSRPPHSTIPLASVTQSIRAPESHIKSTKIYRF